jgi:hypothetical protein
VPPGRPETHPPWKARSRSLPFPSDVRPSCDAAGVGLSLVDPLAPAATGGATGREELLDAVARLLARQVGEHPLPHELALRVYAIERELALLEA